MLLKNRYNMVSTRTRVEAKHLIRLSNVEIDKLLQAVNDPKLLPPGKNITKEDIKRLSGFVENPDFKILQNYILHTRQRFIDASSLHHLELSLRQKLKLSKEDDFLKQMVKPDDNWSHWVLQVLRDTYYQSWVERYMKESTDFKDFVEYTPPGEYGFWVLIDLSLLPTNLTDLHDSSGNLKHLDGVALSIMVKRLRDQNLKQIPLYLLFTDKRINTTTDTLVSDENGWQYTLVVDWKLDRFKWYTEQAHKDALAKYLSDYHPNKLESGIRAFYYNRVNTYNEIEMMCLRHFDMMKCQERLQSTNIRVVPSPSEHVANPLVLVRFIIADTFHDFGITEHMKTYMLSVLKQYLKTRKRRIQSGFDITSTDQTFIQEMETEYLNSSTSTGIAYHVPSMDICSSQVCSFQTQEVMRWDDAKKQELLNSIAGNVGCKAFINFGAYQDVFDTSQIAFTAASRYEGSIKGTYVKDDSGYGFHEDELLSPLLKEVIVHSGYIFMRDKRNILHRYMFAKECIPNKELSSDKYKQMVENCTCISIDSEQEEDVTLLYYDLKRIADMLCMKAALHYKGVFVTHDNMALLGARLYGCPSIYSRYGEDGTMKTFAKKVSINRSDEMVTSDPSTVAPATPDMSGIAANVAKVVAAENVMTEMMEVDSSRKRRRSLEVDEIHHHKDRNVRSPAQSRSIGDEDIRHFATLFVEHSAEYFGIVNGEPDSVSKSEKRLLEECKRQVSELQSMLATRESIHEHERRELERVIIGFRNELLMNDKNQLYTPDLIDYIDSHIRNEGIDPEKMHAYRPYFRQFGTVSQVGGDSGVSRFLLGSMIELLVLSSNTEDLVVKMFKETRKAMDRGEKPRLSAGQYQMISTRVTARLNDLYAKVYGIRTPLDHARTVFMDPSLRLGRRVDISYQNKLRAIVGLPHRLSNEVSIASDVRPRLRQNTKSATVAKSKESTKSVARTATTRSASNALRQSNSKKADNDKVTKRTNTRVITGPAPLPLTIAL